MFHFKVVNVSFLVLVAHLALLNSATSINLEGNKVHDNGTSDSKILSDRRNDKGTEHLPQPIPCHGRLMDGMSYNKSCSEEKPNESKENVTDSEVVDLTSTSSHLSITHSTTEVSKKSELMEPEKMTVSKPGYSIDIISEVDYKSETIPNSHFNLISGAIAATICLTLAVIFYVGIIVAKKISEKRYYNREILLNEDDIGDINDEDMRHFEAACIQIEA